MLYRVGFYGLILVVTLLGALGLGAGDQGSTRIPSSRPAAIAAPLAADNGDNADNADNEPTPTSTATVTGTPPTSTPTRTGTPATSTPTRGDNSDNSLDNADNFDFDNEDNDDNSGDDGGDNLDSLLDNLGLSFATSTPIRFPTLVGTPFVPTGLQPLPSPSPAPAPVPPVGGPCQFVRGFADMHRILNGRDGDCLTNEFSDPKGTGDSLQLTSLPQPNGLMVWNKATNSMRWTDGVSTWAYSKCLLQQRLNTEVFAWELNPYLLIPESAPIPPGACDTLPRLAAGLEPPGS